MLKNIKNKIDIKKHAILLIVTSCFVVSVIFFIPSIVEATTSDLISGTVGVAVATVIGWITSILSAIIGLILTLLIKILVNVAQFNNIINVEAVSQGWKIVRDLCNMFFILILLVIAFATILKLENYSVKKLLPKLLIMAVLINFSRTICGLIIDFGQVIMLTFVNGFGDHGVNNFINLFNIQNYQRISSSLGDKKVSNFSVAGAFIAGLIAMIITTIVVLMMLAILVMRIIMLWVYTILSPLAFLASAFPAGAKYAQQWWGEFTKQVIVGPVLAFFIWLALTTAQKSSTALGTFGAGEGLDGQACAGINAFFCEGNLQTYIITIGLLVGGLMVAQQMGSITGNIAGKGLSWAKGVGRGLGKGSLVGLDWVNRKQASGKRGAGIDLNPFRQAERIKASLDRSKAKDLDDVEDKGSARLKKGGWTGAVGGFTAAGWGDQHLRGFLGYKGLMSAVRGNEDNVGEWRKEEKENKWMAENAGDSYTKNLRGLIHNKINANAAGDEDAVQKYTDEILKLNKNKKELTSHNAEYFTKKQTKAANLAAKYEVRDYEGGKRRRTAENEERSKITSKNEDELIAQFGNAISHNNKSLTGALAKAITEVGGGNALLKKYGYQATAGLTEDEAKGKSDKEIMDKRGLNDFMRDIFEKKLGLDKQSTLALQSDLGGIGEAIGHDYLIKTVGVDDQGRFYQNNEKDRNRVKTEEKIKREPEGVIRKNNRLEYGAEDIHTGDFNWSDSGLATFISNIDMVNKEIDGKRFNRSAAQAITQDDSMAKLMQKLQQLNIKKIQTKEGHSISLKEFTDKLNAYGKQASTDQLDKLLA